MCVALPLLPKTDFDTDNNILTPSEFILVTIAIMPSGKIQNAFGLLHSILIGYAWLIKKNKTGFCMIT